MDEKAARGLFGTYAGEGSDTMGEDGMDRFMAALGLGETDVGQFVFAWKGMAQSSGSLQWSEFKTACTALGYARCHPCSGGSPHYQSSVEDGKRERESNGYRRPKQHSRELFGAACVRSCAVDVCVGVCARGSRVGG